MKINYRQDNGYDRDAVSLETGLKCEDESLAQQHFRDEVDINTIVERFKLTGTVPQLVDLPDVGDYEGIFDFQTAMNQVVAAREQFMTLPANIRARFNNEPQQFLDFCGDAANLEEAEKLGFLSPEATGKLADARKAKMDAQVQKAVEEALQKQVSTEAKPQPKPAPK